MYFIKNYFMSQDLFKQEIYKTFKNLEKLISKVNFNIVSSVRNNEIVFEKKRSVKKITYV